MTPEDKSKIEELKKSLYSRNAPDVRPKRRLRLAPTPASEVPTDWEHPEEKPIEDPELTMSYKNNKGSFFTKLFVGSIIFFAVAMSLGAFLIWNGSNTISANNIDVTINGPVTISGGDPLTFDVQVTNKNNIKLEAVDMAIDFPAGSVDATDRSKELKQFRETMVDIDAGGMGQKRVSAVLYGEENGKKQMVITISYRVAGSNAVFQKQKTYEVLISSSPLSLEVSSFKEVTSGQDFDTTVTLTSNSSDIIKNLLLKVQYPFGYTLTSTDVKAEGNQSTWKIGDIPPHGKKVITFKGQLEGQDGEARDFRFSAGAQSLKTAGLIGTEYIAATQEVSIQKPFISASISFNNDTSGESTGNFNTPVQATITWFNNLQTAIIDGEIHLKLAGNTFDKVSVAPGDGYYKSADNEIVWNKITTPSLSSIGAGESGSVTFSFTPRDFSTPTKPITNPNLTLNVSVVGNRISENNVPESITSSAQRVLQISSALGLSSIVTRSGAPFENSGPIPPQAEKQTTYTITLTVDNTVNTVTGAEVKALLPAYVKWLNKISPAGEDISYNITSGQLDWRVGNVDTATVTSGHRRTVSFQVALTPSVAQVNQAPILLQDTTLSGIDDYTGATLTATAPALSTRFSTDPTYHDGNDLVTP